MYNDILYMYSDILYIYNDILYMYNDIYNDILYMYNDIPYYTALPFSAHTINISIQGVYININSYV